MVSSWNPSPPLIWSKTCSATHLRFRYLRHIRATLMLKDGVHPKIVSERLGHANVGITLDTYSRVLPGLQETQSLMSHTRDGDHKETIDHWRQAWDQFIESYDSVIPLAKQVVGNIAAQEKQLVAQIEQDSREPGVDLLDREIFTTLEEVGVLIEQWRKEYNQVRPHSAKNYPLPAPETILTMATT